MTSWSAKFSEDTREVLANLDDVDELKLIEQDIDVEIVDDDYFLDEWSEPLKFNMLPRVRYIEIDLIQKLCFLLEFIYGKVDVTPTSNVQGESHVSDATAQTTKSTENSELIFEHSIVNAEEEIKPEKIIEKVKPKSLKMYYIFGGFCICSLIFFSTSYALWYLDNNSTKGVVSNVIAETTSKHKLVSTDIFTDNETIKEIQVGQVFDFLEVDFEPLIERNNDVWAYLKVAGVQGLEYPVMQTTDNEYYLDKDIDKHKSGAGWLFVDCRNNLELMQFNTIIYGHNRVDGLMFGKLKNLLKGDVVKQDNADKIYFNTRTGEMIYEVCSVYVTTYDDWEYYDVDFSEKQKENFITRLNKLNQAPIFARSDLSTLDSFLTLSTCYGGAGTEKRLVVHARLIALK